MGIAARITKRTAIIGTVSAVALAGGIAYAAWTISGSGTASASSGSAVDVSFAPGVAAGPLYPNAPAVAVHASGTNTNPFAVDFAISGGTIAADSGHSTCNTAAALQFVSAGTVHMNAGTSGADFTVGTIAMNNNALDSCQGATFTITLSGSGVSA